ncbi:hypothetical protein GCM10022198_25070 [Klugiella xanthotipulae]|uniref:Ribosomal protein S18 acetylase RimI-like enzyme n=1 Tax=Klugiella xanthotipulae TaxID=244735 RepID=A0A543HZ28_9MICO|nr:GNAT family N-acetyltransferase [Klugiella xanthotipulae]TQM63602.1 ribosomal protein S18 acetylase RimI-like enzyme [Klugiella xanthotipulae]
MNHDVNLAPARGDASLTVREALPEEYPRVAELVVAAFAAGPYGHLPVSPERRDLMANTAARAAEGSVLVAVVAAGEDPSGTLVGTVTLVRSGARSARLATPDEVELRLLAVDVAWQGRGVADILLEASLDLARAAGAARLVLDTGSQNYAAQRSYYRHGFSRNTARDAALVSVEKPEITAWVFERPLTDLPPVTVRMARPVEYAAIADLSAAAYTGDYEVSPGYLDSIRDVAPRAREHEVWVAVDTETGELLGTVATPRAGGAISELALPGEIDFRLLAVAPAARGRGVGELLTRFVLALGRERGCTRAVMNSGVEMVGAHRLYAKLGFARIPERETSFVGDHGRIVHLLAFAYDLG